MCEPGPVPQVGKIVRSSIVCGTFLWGFGCIGAFKKEVMGGL